MGVDFISCVKRNGGLKLVEPNQNLAQVYLRKSRSALNMLNSALEKHENEWVLDTSYYARYFAVYALFMQAGLKSEIHDCTILGFKRLFSGLIDPALHLELEESREMRVKAIYYDESFGNEAIIKMAKNAPRFCLRMEQVLRGLTDAQIDALRGKFRANSQLA